MLLSKGAKKAALSSAKGSHGYAKIGGKLHARSKVGFKAKELRSARAEEKKQQRHHRRGHGRKRKGRKGGKAKPLGAPLQLGRFMGPSGRLGVAHYN